MVGAPDSLAALQKKKRGGDRRHEIEKENDGNGEEKKTKQVKTMESTVCFVW